MCLLSPALVFNLIFVVSSLWLFVAIYRFSDARSLCLCDRSAFGFACDCYGADLRNATTEWVKNFVLRKF